MTNYSVSAPATQEENSAEIIPFKSPAKQEYDAAIRMWCVDRSLSTVLEPQEIGALRRDDRIDAQCKSIIIHLCHYYRQHPRADVAPGVAVIIALLSDNEKGLATISQPTLATLFGRSRSAIGDAQKRLKDAHIIGMTRGRFAGSYPIVPREVTRQYNHKVWLIDALNTQDGALNQPAPPADCQSTGPTGGLGQSTGHTGGLKSVNQPVETISINRPDATQLHSKNSTTLDRAAAVVAAGIATAMGTLPAAAKPEEPPAIIQPVKQDISYDELKAKLLTAGGEAIADAPDIEVLSLPRSWLANGCDLVEDILPAIKARAAKMPKRSIRSWKYFAQAVANAKAAREAPMPEGRATAPPAGGFVPEWRRKEEAAYAYLFRKE